MHSISRSSPLASDGFSFFRFVVQACQRHILTRIRFRRIIYGIRSFPPLHKETVMFVRFSFILLLSVLLGIPAFADECLSDAEFKRLDQASVVIFKQISNPSGDTLNLIMTLWKDFPRRETRGRNFPTESWRGSPESQSVDASQIFEDIRKTVARHFQMSDDDRDAARWTRSTTITSKQHCSILINEIGSVSCHRFITITCGGGTFVSYPMIEYWARRNDFFDSFARERAIAKQPQNRR